MESTATPLKPAEDVDARRKAVRGLGRMATQVTSRPRQGWSERKLRTRTRVRVCATFVLLPLTRGSEPRGHK